MTSKTGQALRSPCAAAVQGQQCVLLAGMRPSENRRVMLHLQPELSGHPGGLERRPTMRRCRFQTLQAAGLAGHTGLLHCLPAIQSLISLSCNALQSHLCTYWHIASQELSGYSSLNSTHYSLAWFKNTPWYQEGIYSQSTAHKGRLLTWRPCTPGPGPLDSCRSARRCCSCRLLRHANPCCAVGCPLPRCTAPF